MWSEIRRKKQREKSETAQRQLPVFYLYDFKNLWSRLFTINSILSNKFGLWREKFLCFLSVKRERTIQNKKRTKGIKTFLNKQKMVQKQRAWTTWLKYWNIILALDKLRFKKFLEESLYYEENKNIKKNPAYGRQSISRPMRILAPIPQ